MNNVTKIDMECTAVNEFAKWYESFFKGSPYDAITGGTTAHAEEVYPFYESALRLGYSRGYDTGYLDGREVAMGVA